MSPFTKTFTLNFIVNCKYKTFGLEIKEDRITRRTYDHEIHSISTVSKSFRTKQEARKKINGHYIIAINDKPVFSKEDIIKRFTAQHELKSYNITITFAKTPKLYSDKKWSILEDL